MIRSYTEDELFDLLVSFLQEKYPKASMSQRAHMGQQARAIAEVVGALQQSIREADADGIPGYQVDYDGIIRSRCSSEAIDGWMFTFGVPSNRGAGVYGRNAAQAASGGAVTATGVPGTVIPGGSTLADESGTVVVLVSAVTLTGLGTGFCPLVAQSPGVAGNLPAGVLLRWQSPVAGLNPTAILGNPLINGIDVESDYDAITRLLRRLQSPPKGGTHSDWRERCETATDSAGRLVGIDRAWIYGIRNGSGSVDCVITQAANGVDRDPGAAKAALVAAALDKLRIVTDSYRVIRPSFAPPMRIMERVIPAAGYEYDWDDQQVGTPILSATGDKVGIAAGSFPASLKAAFDSGQLPRIQVSGLSTGPLPEMRRVYGYLYNTPAAGQTSLVLEAPFSASPVGQDLYAGGGAVGIVAVAVLSYINSIGPSRQSGYASPTDVWEDVVSVSRIAQVSLNARDVAARVLLYDPRVGEGVGILISQSGIEDSKDRKLFDNLPGTVGPQLPVCVGILIVKGPG